VLSSRGGVPSDVRECASEYIRVLRQSEKSVVLSRAIRERHAFLRRRAQRSSTHHLTMSRQHHSKTTPLFRRQQITFDSNAPPRGVCPAPDTQPKRVPVFNYRPVHTQAYDKQRWDIVDVDGDEFRKICDADDAKKLTARGVVDQLSKLATIRNAFLDSKKFASLRDVNYRIVSTLLALERWCPAYPRLHPDEWSDIPASLLTDTILIMFCEKSFCFDTLNHFFFVGTHPSTATQIPLNVSKVTLDQAAAAMESEMKA
jgi:hypothetical protein